MSCNKLQFLTTKVVLTVALLSATGVSGVADVPVQTPFAPVRGAWVRVSRGGPLASLAPAITQAAPRTTPSAKNAPPLPSGAMQQKQKPQSPAAKAAANTPQISEDNTAFEQIYSNFHKTYRLGPSDEIALRVVGQPDYSIEKAKVSPDGRVFHPLLGDVHVGGLTVGQLTRKLTKELTRYLIGPVVSVHLIEARSAKIGVIGEVPQPGIILMNEPMTVLDAINHSGGFAVTGSKSNVSLVRLGRDGRMQTYPVNIKKILAGKADVEENLPLHPGDTIIVHGNMRRKLDFVTSLIGFSQFLTFGTMVRR